MDNLAITGNCIPEFKMLISSHWEMEDLGIVQMVVGIGINRVDEFSYSLSQSKFAQTILARF